MAFPTFSDEKVITKEYSFIGKVQRVGFRVEMKYIADQIGVTGYVKNMEKNKVYAMLQGTKEKIDFIVKTMKEEKRINITKISFKKLENKIIYKEFLIK